MITVHADVVGSLLRPPELLGAQKQFAAGEITAAQFKDIEDHAVDEAIALQEKSGLEIVTDGEMRRQSFQSQMTAAVSGFGEFNLDAFLWGDWHDEQGVQRKHRPRRLGAVATLKRLRYLSADEFCYVKSKTNRIPKVTLPSPGLWANFWSPKYSGAVYPTLDAFLADITAIVRGEIAELTRLGAIYIQIDAPHYGLLLDPKTLTFYEKLGWNLDRWLSLGVELDNAVMQGFSDVTFGFHICRGNQGSRWLSQGGYESISRQLFRNLKAQRLLLEYDDPRSGSFEPLRDVPEDKFVVLGLITTKRPGLESMALLSRRITEASRYVSLERLGLSPQCGFASSIIGNRISVEDQQRKLELVVKTARAAWR
jgi:5-methyltetrahydropteroyltriglutamate--homocysteine methyltransferase